MEMALAESEISPENVQYLNAHGTATLVNDVVETNAIKKVFGKWSSHLPVSSTKPITGHLLGACGGVEAAITLLAVERGFVPATLNLSCPDDACDLDYVPGCGRHQEIEFAMSNNSSFGGRNASLLFRRFCNE
jgi:3-oxoacyl-[acyl-carrier-protein] synthase II